ncbi:MAG: M28 family peptidase [Acidobacteriota bacterium]|nr:M28 family peptidase [Acidobacteriota bacterium]
MLRIPAIYFLLAMGTAQPALKSVNPVVRKIVDSISQERITASLKKLESFQTRNVFSATDNQEHGIGAARRWILAEVKSYSPRFEAGFDTHRVKKQGRIVRDVELVNVVAVLPGTLRRDRQLIVSAHYDSADYHRTPATEASSDEVHFDLAQSEQSAPGVNDDGSGTAAVLELARVLSQYEFEETIVFIAFAGEEQGLIGSTLYAAKARRENRVIDAVLNNDIVGGARSGNGFTDNGRLRIFSEEPSDSLSREVARYAREIGERYLPSMKVDPVFRADRFARGGDHTPFNQEGYAAVRFTTPQENFSDQHTATDTFANASASYTTRVTKINAAVLASLALAPAAPVVMQTIEKGERKGQISAMIGRGKSRYDAQLKWKNEHPEPDLAGYVVTMRSTTSPFWEREIFAGNVNEFVMENVSIDDAVFGVKAIDRDGNESLVSTYVYKPFPKRTIETY